MEPKGAPAQPSAAALHWTLKVGAVSPADLRASLPSEVFVLSPWRSWLALAVSIAIIVLGEAILAATRLEAGCCLLWTAPIAIIGWLTVATGMTRLFILGHDCGHHAFSRSVRVNDFVGHLCMAPFLSSYHGWRIGHNHHHANTLLRGSDIDWAEGLMTRSDYERTPPLRRALIRVFMRPPIALFTGFFIGLVRRAFMRLYRQVPTAPTVRRQLLVSKLALLAVSGGIVVALVVGGGAGALAKYYLVPIELGMIAGGFLTYFHHHGDGALAYDRESWTPVLGQLTSTFDHRYPAWIEWLFLNASIHRVHHLAPTIPYYHLPAATRTIASAFPEMHIEHRFSFARARRAFRVRFLEPLEDGVYVQTVADATGSQPAARRASVIRPSGAA